MQIVLFIRATSTDQLQIEAIREVLLIKIDALFRQSHVATQQTPADVTHSAAGEQQQSFAQLRQPFPVNPRAERPVTALIGARDQQRQVLVAVVIHRQDGDLRHFIGEQLALNVKVGAYHRL
ncbi:hypothetical protein D3C75_246610 [compost metagenome]